MSLIASANTSKYTPAPEGTHRARCAQVIDLGTHKSQWNGQTRYSHKVRIGWELSDERTKEGRPYSVSQTYTLSLEPSAILRRDLETWRGRAFTEEELNGFHLKHITDVPALVTVVHSSSSGRTYAKVSSVAKLPASMGTPPPLVSKPLLYEVEAGKSEVFETLPPFLKEKICACREWNPSEAATESDSQAEPQEGDVPF
jgi:hypothetical protein